MSNEGFKTAKSLFGNVYSYAVITAGEFLFQLSIEKDIPIDMLKLLDEEIGELQPSQNLLPDHMYAIYVKSGIREWIDESKLDLYYLIDNPNEQVFSYFDCPTSINHIEKRAEEDMASLNNYFWYDFCRNPEAIHIIEKYPSRIYWEPLSSNPAAIHLLEQNPEKINWCELSSNPAAIHLLEQNPEKINWCALSGNPAAIHLLEQNPEKINWCALSRNPAAIRLLEQKIMKGDSIGWSYLIPEIFQKSELIKNKYMEVLLAWKEVDHRSLWTHFYQVMPDSILLEQYMGYTSSFWLREEQDSWRIVSSNPAAIHLLQRNQDKIHWGNLSLNPSIFYPKHEL